MRDDRKFKQKMARKNKKLALRREVHSQQLRDKAHECCWRAEKEYYSKDFPSAYSWTMKGLKLDPCHTGNYEIALSSAARLGDDELIYGILNHGWKHSLILYKRDLFVFGKMSFERNNYKLAQEAFQTLVQTGLSLIGKFPKFAEKELQRLLALCQEKIREDSMQDHPQVTNMSKQAKLEFDPDVSAFLKSEPGEISTSVESIIPEPVMKKEPPVDDLPKLKIEYESDTGPILKIIKRGIPSERRQLDLALNAFNLSFRNSYDQLISLPALRDVRSLWYQEETAQKIMKTFRGRAILADEVGLGKTIEAGLILKEYHMRDLVRSALILTPSSLVNQWDEELREKFNLFFINPNDPLFKKDPESFWSQPYILASIQTAKSKRHFDLVTQRAYDMVIIDEAHHLKNRNTLNWKLVNAIQKTYLLLLTATPVQNNLEELFNLVTLLKPGHLKTRKAFMEEFVARGNPTDPINRERLRELLKEVMVRNTRAVAQLNLPPRFATTLRVDPAPQEKAFYQGISQFVTQFSTQSPTTDIPKMTLRKLLEAAGSSVPAAINILSGFGKQDLNSAGQRVREILEMGKDLGPGCKLMQALNLIKASLDQKIIFVRHLATLEYFHEVLIDRHIAHVVYHGALSPAQKQAVIKTFEDGCPVLLTSESGGEGHNFQFCHMMINLDLPWNPMQIEQRIGRLHRIGQEKEVLIYNLCTAGSLEDYMLDVLDKKINMFELVIGELDMILGRIEGEKDFSDMVYELWVNNPEDQERQKAFQTFGFRLKRTKSAYEKSKELDEKLFREDFGV